MAKHKLGAARTADPLQAVPLVSQATRTEPLTSRQGLLVYRTDPAKGRLFGWLATRLGWKRERAFELDGIGAQFYREVDGRRSLVEIQKILVSKFGFDEKAARDAIVLYTSELMRRGLLVLRVEPGDDSARNHD